MESVYCSLMYLPTVTLANSYVYLKYDIWLWLNVGRGKWITWFSTGRRNLSSCLNLCIIEVPLYLLSYLVMKATRGSSSWCQRCSIWKQHYGVECSHFWVRVDAQPIMHMDRFFSNAPWELKWMTEYLYFLQRHSPEGTPFEDGKYLTLFTLINLCSKE